MGSWLPGSSREAMDPSLLPKWWNTVCGLSICLLFCRLLAHCSSLSLHHLLQEQEPSATSISIFRYILHILHLLQEPSVPSIFLFRYILHILCCSTSFRAFLLHFILSKVLTFGVSVLHIPLNRVLHAEYHIFTEISHGTLTAVLLHRRRRTLIIPPYVCHLSISVYSNLGLFPLSNEACSISHDCNLKRLTHHVPAYPLQFSHFVF